MSGLYIHIPFCHSKCNYCDFYSGLRVSSSEGYIDAIIEELQMRRGEIKDRFSTIYIGGGTPSIMPVDELQRLVTAIASTTDMSAVKEFTIEVNPEDVDVHKLKSYKEMGINRISMGVQSFDDNMLKAINRRHSAGDALEAIALLKEGGWNYSIDLMFGLPEQSPDMWQRDVDRAMGLRPPHISAYLLSYEPGTRLYAMLSAGKVNEATEEVATAMNKYFVETSAKYGYHHYEISNYALPGCYSRHNSSYWDMTPYLGLGASAHSFDGKSRRVNPSNIKCYLSAINSNEIAAEVEDENLDEIFNDYIITGLRTSKGVDLQLLSHRFPKQYLKELLDDAAGLVADGQLILTDHLIIPESYWLKSDAIMRQLLRV